MAIISKGVLGGFQGKVGNLVGSAWRSLDVIRTLPKRVKRIPTDKQINIRAKFLMVSGFVKPLRAFLYKSFNDRSLRYENSHNKVLGEIFTNAVVGSFPNLEFDYSKISLSRGPLQLLRQINVLQTDSSLDLNWDADDELMGNVSGLVVYVILYSVQDGTFKLKNVGSRDVHRGSISISEFRKDERVISWIFSSDKENTRFSNSQFMGEYII